MDTESRSLLNTCKAPDWCDTSSMAGGHEPAGASLSDIGSLEGAMGARVLENEWAEGRLVERPQYGMVDAMDTMTIRGFTVQFGEAAPEESPPWWLITEVDPEAERVAEGLGGPANYRLVCEAAETVAYWAQSINRPSESLLGCIAIVEAIATALVNRKTWPECLNLERVDQPPPDQSWPAVLDTDKGRLTRWQVWQLLDGFDPLEATVEVRDGGRPETVEVAIASACFLAPSSPSPSAWPSAYPGAELGPEKFRPSSVWPQRKPEEE